MTDLRRILVVDDQEFVAKGIATQLLSDIPIVRAQLELQNLIFEVIPVCSLKQVENVLQRVRIDLVILDLNLEDGFSEIETLASTKEMLRKAGCEAHVAIFSAARFRSAPGLELLRSALNNYDVMGVIPKSTPAAKVVESIARLLEGEEWYPADLLRALSRPTQPSAGDERLGLTKREWEIALLLSDGLPNKRIAAKLEISEEHTKQMVSDILQKLGVGNRTQAAIRVYKETHLKNLSGGLAPQ